jgi:NAD(P)-dependent dehydrogenase (short-subunit alcohol dehydrogenase family)
MSLFQGKVALITGASQGFGAALALELAAKGVHILALSKNTQKLEHLDDQIQAIGGNATLIPCDLQEMDQFPYLAQKIYERFGKLDIFIGNAAILGPLKPFQQILPAEFDAVMNINFFAHNKLLQLCDPLLRKAKNPRVILVSSRVVQIHPAFWGAYTVSKAALEAMAGVYAAETKETNLRINIVDPGVMRTTLRAEAFPGENPELLILPETKAKHIWPLLEESCSFHGQLLRITESGLE